MKKNCVYKIDNCHDCMYCIEGDFDWDKGGRKMKCNFGNKNRLIKFVKARTICQIPDWCKLENA